MILSIDIGGSKIKYGFINQKGKLFSPQKFDTPSTYEKLLDEIRLILKTSTNKIEGIAISSAGVVHENGLIGGLAAIPYILEKNMKIIFEKEFKMKISVENDANCTSLSYLWEESQVNSLISISIGTGVGGSIILNNQLYKGQDDWVAELGLISIKLPDKTISVHKSISTSCVLKRINKHYKNPITGQEAFELYKKGDLMVIKYFQQWFNNIAQLIINLEYLLNPQVILLTGGVTKQELFLEQILEERKNIVKVSNAHEFSTKIICSKHANNANILGAAYKWYDIYS